MDLGYPVVFFKHLLLQVFVLISQIVLRDGWGFSSERLYQCGGIFFSIFLRASFRSSFWSASSADETFSDSMISS